MVAELASTLTAQSGPRENEGPMSSKAPVSMAAPRTAAGSPGRRGQGGRRPQRCAGSTRGSDLSPSRGARRPGWPGGRRERRGRRRRRDGGQSDGRRCGRDPARRQQGGGSPGDERSPARWQLRDRACLRSRHVTEPSNRRPVLSWGHRSPRVAGSAFGQRFSPPQRCLFVPVGKSQEPGT